MVSIALIISLLISVFLVWQIPLWQVKGKGKVLEAKDFANLENEYRKTIVQNNWRNLCAGWFSILPLKSLI